MYDWIATFTHNERCMRRLAAFLGRLPRPVVFAGCAAIGWTLYGLAGRKLRRLIRGNMRDVLAGAGERTLRAYSRRYFVNLAVTLYEIMLDSARLPQTGPHELCAEGEHYLEQALARGKGAIVYLPHVGNFFYYYWYLTQKYDCLAVVTASGADIRPLYLNFLKLGCNGLDYDETPPLELVRQLKAQLARGGVVFILGDFYRPNFPQTTLFGRLTRAPAGAAAIAIEQQAPVVPLYGKRKSGFHHVLVFGEPLRLHETFTCKQRAEALRVLNATLERGIRAAPEQWFYWFNAHERWESPAVSASDGQDLTGENIRADACVARANG